MKNIYEQCVCNEVCQRIANLTEQSRAKWGKMDVAQMLAHCTASLQVPLADKPAPRMISGYLFGWMLKRKLVDDSPMGKSLPTAPGFKII